MLSGDPTDAIEFLNKDHVLIEALFRRYQDVRPGRASKKPALFREIRDELEAHRMIEEEIFYPAILEAQTPKAERLVREAIEEHRVIQQLLRELADGKPGTNAFDATFKVLEESALDHAQEEETTLFRKVLGSMSDEDLERLGQELADRKHELGRRVRRPERLVTKTSRADSRARRR